MKNKIAYSLVVGYLFIVAQLSNSSIIAQITDVKPKFIYEPEIITPAYTNKGGSKVYLDEGHYNRHTYGGLGDFIAFRKVLSKDGYQVVTFKDQFTTTTLQRVRLMVIALAQNKNNLGEDKNHLSREARAKVAEAVIARFPNLGDFGFEQKQMVSMNIYGVESEFPQ